MKDIAKKMCTQALQIIDTYETLSTSGQIDNKFQAARTEIQGFLNELDNNEDVSLPRIQVMADRITAIGHDLVNYGKLILPGGSKT